MGYRSHLSRREILNSIPLLKSGACLLPVSGQSVPAAKGVIRGALRDEITGRPIAAKLRVTSATTGDVFMPDSCIKTMPKRSPSGVRYFYARGAYEVAVPPGRYRIEVIRGICHEPAVAEVDVEAGAARVTDFPIRHLYY